jgi:hypothetical protein
VSRSLASDIACWALGLSLALTPATAWSHEQRSRAVTAEFQRAHPCPATGRSSGACPGWICDHIEPLACGGADAFVNLQWQTIAEAKAKDRCERKDCPIGSKG